MNAPLDTFFVLGFVLVAFANGELHWCYNNASCNENVWVSTPFGTCNGTRQSPLNINTTSVKGNSNLIAFNFTGFSNNSTMTTIENSGHTVKVTFGDGLVKISGGGLPGSYDVQQFHLHWGNGSDVPGSEHTVDGKHYPMEIHIVTMKSEFKGNMTLAITDSNGLAVLGFLIEKKNDSSLPQSWKILTTYLPNITNSGQKVNITQQFSLDDLLVGVDRTKYYRYLGSLTTPTCDEVVIWTVFKDPVKVSKNLIDLFSTSLYTSDPVLMTNTYRSTQKPNGRNITTQASASSPLMTEARLFLLPLVVLHVLLWECDA
ncbi:carbonic anhydrase 4-like isoform X1 [Brienomyrus brachyistius]|uniref:carbonic anhydrase 4-like isoform X1 n=1 Tax=Brienomyrus brachyistius TaxID=42636 RepID=UPI0020B1AFB5|nr:carbonic anhydrase 4-like isoform X1 [Brienomyrus brachyistius]